MNHQLEPVHEDLPTFVLRPIIVNGKMWARAFVCPSCGRLRSHGRGDGHVAAHCSCWPHGYYIRHDEERPLRLTASGLDKLLRDIRMERTTCL